MMLNTATVLRAFRRAIPRARALVPLTQAQVKLVVALSVDDLCSGLPERVRLPRGRLRLFANRLKKHRKKFHATKLELHESMVDVAVYSGATDPFSAVFTAESEAFARHAVGAGIDTEHSDFLWDLFKLVQVPSPNRLFVARVVSKLRTARPRRRASRSPLPGAI